jgi:hypothetical protein
MTMVLAVALVTAGVASVAVAAGSRRGERRCPSVA